MGFGDSILRKQNKRWVSLSQEASGGEKALGLSGESHVAELLQGWLRASWPVILAEQSFESTHTSKAPRSKTFPRPIE